MKLVPNAVSRKLAQQALKHRKNAPKLLFGAGIAGTTASTVLACRATLRLEEIVNKTQVDLQVASELVQTHPDQYTEHDRKSDVAKIYLRGAGNIAQLYAPAVLLGVASVGCLTKSHNMLQERNLALTAAYAAVDEAFKKYRTKVVEKYGEDEDRYFRYAHEEVVVTDEETGREVTRIRVNNEEGHSQYARFFDELCTEWSKEAEYNFTFLRQKQNWMNDLLKMRGYVFLNQVYEELGLAPTSAGSVVGWLLDGNGDSYIDFGLFRTEDESVIDFVNGRNNSVLLDFNVDGVIYDKIDNLKGGFGPWQK
jgi:Family of unknown function (DUF6353)